MHNDIVIMAEGISKKFCRSLRHVMFYGVQDIARNTFGMSSNSEMLREGEFWAVNDISFEVKKGETLGIIGANGSGKTTLLKLLNGIFMPDKGRIEIKGRVGALIEVGAGFHPMLTGRENIYVNGAILGMSKKEVDKKFDEIVEFAGIGDFLDAPVKHYSSGMYVRLGFAVAVHCDPDILLVDEVLAVGDASFQNKCYKRLSEFKAAGKTIILVTHDMDAIVKHCGSALLIENGVFKKTGKPNDVVNCYYEIILSGTLPSLPSIKNSVLSILPDVKQENALSNSVQSQLEKFLEEIPTTDKCIYRNSYNKNEHRHGNKRAEVVDYLIVRGNECSPAIIYSGDVVDIYLKVKFHDKVEYPVAGFMIKTVDGVEILGYNSFYTKTPCRPAKISEIIIYKFSIKMDMKAGDYFIGIGVTELINETYEHLDSRQDLVELRVLQNKPFGGLVYLETTFKEVSSKDDKKDGTFQD